MKKSWSANAIDILVPAAWLLLITQSCQPLKESSKYQLTEGFYKMHGRSGGKIYLLTGTDTIKGYRKADLNTGSTDSIKAIRFLFPPVKPANFRSLHFRRSTLDADVLTVLFKYRPHVWGFPPQFNTTFNGAVYLGYRIDDYELSYKSSPLHVFRRNITHYGCSMGLFSGLGSAHIDGYNTNSRITIEYEGLVNLSGMAFILAIDKLTAGLTIGQDRLLDRNRKFWLNNGKPWIGLSLGLNLN